MSEYDFRDNLVSLGRFNTPTEGSIARARLEEEGIPAQLGSDATATWLNYVGPDLIGAELFVRQGDLRRAREILAEVLEHPDSETEEDDEDWSGEAWSDDDGDDDDDEWSAADEAAVVVTPPMVRAFRASIIGCLLLPPLVNCYSCWLIVRHRLWESSDNGRYYGTLAFNILGFFVGWWLWLAR